MDIVSVFWINLNFAMIYLDIDVGLYLLTDEEPAVESSLSKTFHALDLSLFIGGRAVAATGVSWLSAYAGEMLGLPQGGWQFTLLFLLVLGFELLLRDRKIAGKLPGG